jgi:hypothetical protein
MSRREIRYRDGNPDLPSALSQDRTATTPKRPRPRRGLPLFACLLPAALLRPFAAPEKALFEVYADMSSLHLSAVALIVLISLWTVEGGRDPPTLQRGGVYVHYGAPVPSLLAPAAIWPRCAADPTLVYRLLAGGCPERP